MKTTPLPIAALAMVALLSGCAASYNPNVDASLGTIKARALTADYRLVTEQPNPKGPLYPAILCAEQSPDIARAVSNQQSASGTVGVKSPTATSVDAGGAFQSQSAQAIAQLGNRSYTLGILREYIQSNCRDYANGQLSETTAAILKSRFNSWVVTLTALDLVSGYVATPPGPVSSPTLVVNNTGGGTIVAHAAPPASAASAAEAASAAATKTKGSVPKPSGLRKAQFTPDSGGFIKVAALTEAEAPKAAAAPGVEPTKSKKGTAKNIATKAPATDVVPETPTTPGMTSVEAIVAMQQKYIDKEDLGPSLLACFIYFDPPDAQRKPSKDSPLYHYCEAILLLRVQLAELALQVPPPADSSQQNGSDKVAPAKSNGSSKKPVTAPTPRRISDKVIEDLFSEKGNFAASNLLIKKFNFPAIDNAEGVTPPSPRPAASGASAVAPAAAAAASGVR